MKSAKELLSMDIIFTLLDEFKMSMISKKPEHFLYNLDFSTRMFGIMSGTTHKNTPNDRSWGTPVMRVQRLGDII